MFFMSHVLLRKREKEVCGVYKCVETSFSETCSAVDNSEAADSSRPILATAGADSWQRDLSLQLHIELIRDNLRNVSTCE